MVCTSRTTGEHRAGCSKRPDFSPAQPCRAETHLVPSKAATPRLTLVSRFTISGSEARTPYGKRRVSARRGRAGEKSDFFSILLVNIGASSRYQRARLAHIPYFCPPQRQSIWCAGLSCLSRSSNQTNEIDQKDQMNQIPPAPRNV
jgi:hypothetical protein